MDGILIVVHRAALDFVSRLDGILVRDKDSAYEVIVICHNSAFIATMIRVRTIFQLSLDGEQDNIYLLCLSIMII